MKIITVEDPVEYQLKGVNQIPVKPKIGLTFAQGLRHIVRQDPDVILVGEIRDLETAEIAIQASLTGHLVFSTLHTNDAPGAITRLHDMGVEPYLVASVLEGVLAQRLVRRICPACRVPDTPSAADLDALGIEAARPAPTLFRGKGCDDCRGTGYRGRSGHLRAVHPSTRTRAASSCAAPPPATSASTRSSAAWSRCGWTAASGRARASPRSRRFSGSRRKTPDAMPVFTYRAADRRGQTIDGVMEAADARAVVERLRKEAYFPIKVAAQGERVAVFSLGGGGARVRQRDLLAFTQMLATLFEAGLPLDRALSILEELAPVAARAHDRHRSPAQRARRLLAQRGAGQASSAAVLAPVHQHGAGRREGRRAGGLAAAAGRVPGGARGVQRGGRLRPRLPARHPDASAPPPSCS